MRAIDLQAARLRQRRAVRAASCLGEVKRFSELDDEWAAVLTALRLVTAKLGKGARGCDVSEAWWAELLVRQKEDQLLTYLLQARNGEHHGLSGVANAYQIIAPESGVIELEVSNEGGEVRFHLRGNPAEEVFLPLTGQLLPITNRGVTYEPPRTHLGLPVDATVFDVADRAVAFHSQLLEEAEALPVHD